LDPPVRILKINKISLPWKSATNVKMEQFADRVGSLAGYTHLSSAAHILQLPDSLIIHILGYFVSKHGLDMDTYNKIQQICKKFHSLVNSRTLWYDIPLTGYVDLCRLTESFGIMSTFHRLLSYDSNRNKGLNTGAFKFIKVRIERGTGKCSLFIILLTQSFIHSLI
jgi:hypothetical protein